MYLFRVTRIEENNGFCFIRENRRAANSKYSVPDSYDTPLVFLFARALTQIVPVGLYYVRLNRAVYSMYIKTFTYRSMCLWCKYTKFDYIITGFRNQKYRTYSRISYNVDSNVYRFLRRSTVLFLKFVLQSRRLV